MRVPVVDMDDEEEDENAWEDDSQMPQFHLMTAKAMPNARAVSARAVSARALAEGLSGTSHSCTPRLAGSPAQRSPDQAVDANQLQEEEDADYHDDLSVPAFNLLRPARPQAAAPAPRTASSQPNDAFDLPTFSLQPRPAQGELSLQQTRRPSPQHATPEPQDNDLEDDLDDAFDDQETQAPRFRLLPSQVHRPRPAQHPAPHRAMQNIVQTAHQQPTPTVAKPQQQTAPQPMHELSGQAAGFDFFTTGPSAPAGPRATHAGANTPGLGPTSRSLSQHQHPESLIPQHATFHATPQLTPSHTPLHATANYLQQQARMPALHSAVPARAAAATDQPAQHTQQTRHAQHTQHASEEEDEILDSDSEQPQFQLVNSAGRPWGGSGGKAMTSGLAAQGQHSGAAGVTHRTPLTLHSAGQHPQRPATATAAPRNTPAVSGRGAEQSTLVGPWQPLSTIPPSAAATPILAGAQHAFVRGIIGTDSGAGVGGSAHVAGRHASGAPRAQSQGGGQGAPQSVVRNGWSLSVEPGTGRPTLSLLDDSDSDQERQHQQQQGNTQYGNQQQARAQPPTISRPWRREAQTAAKQAPPQPWQQQEQRPWGEDWEAQGVTEQGVPGGWQSEERGAQGPGRHEELGMRGTAQQGKEAAAGGAGGNGSGDEGILWWQLLEDFVPVELLKDGKDPRDGGRVHVLYQQQFTEGASAAHQALQKRHAAGAEDDAMLAAGGWSGKSRGKTPGTGASRKRRTSSAANTPADHGGGADEGLDGGGEEDLGQPVAVGRWFTETGGVKVYVDATGKSHTGSAAFRKWKSEKAGRRSGGGRSRGRKAGGGKSGGKGGGFRKKRSKKSSPGKKKGGGGDDGLGVKGGVGKKGKRAAGWQAVDRLVRKG